MSQPRKYLFITGGVLSSIGKGISAASLGMLLEQRGISLTLVKMDPYLNVDPGTMNPFQHGEVFVLDDGAETDMDLGHYSRFVERVPFSRKNSFTTGRIYDEVIRRERAGGYLGNTVQVIPHITDEIKRQIRHAAQDTELAIVEVGGTVGDIESLPFLEAIRQIRAEEGAANVLFIHLTLVPYISAASELKTKPTQHSVRELREIGIQPDLLLCRADRPLPAEVREKIGLFCNLSAEHVFCAMDVETIYDVPLHFFEEGLDQEIVDQLGLDSKAPDLSAWRARVERIRAPADEIDLAIIGKYTDWRDSYKSISEALVHAGVQANVRVRTHFLNAEELECHPDTALLNTVDGILVPGGFGERGVEGMIIAIQHARTHRIPYLGICLGMQLAVVEFARHVAGIKNAHSAEFRPEGRHNVIELLQDQRLVRNLGGTMRLGAYPCLIVPEHQGVPTHAFRAYQALSISERHRHRFEVSLQMLPELRKGGLIVSGILDQSPDTLPQSVPLEIIEIIELPDHPWFVGCQFHPEFKSTLSRPHPLFGHFVEHAGAYRRERLRKPEEHA